MPSADYNKYQNGRKCRTPNISLSLADLFKPQYINDTDINEIHNRACRSSRL